MPRILQKTQMADFGFFSVQNLSVANFGYSVLVGTL